MDAIDLVVTDLDGTLWELADDVHPRTVDALAAIERRGHPLLVATGRRIASTRAPLAALGLAPPAVVLNGAVALELATDERFHRHPFPAPDAGRVLAAFSDAGIEPCVYVDHDEVDVFVSPRPSTHPDHVRSFGAAVATSHLEEVVATVPVLAFGALGLPADPPAHVAARLDGVAQPHVSPDRQYGGTTITVAPLGLSKWAGVEVFCARAGLDPSRVLAIGDGPNDVELLARAAVAVAPEDSHPGALAVADHVVPRAAEGGWADILDLL